jgi:hypothetical protein
MGFLEMRLVNKGSNRHLCFVDFATPAQAFLAMRSLQGEYNTIFLYSFLSLAAFVMFLGHLPFTWRKLSYSIMKLFKLKHVVLDGIFLLCSDYEWRQAIFLL